MVWLVVFGTLNTKTLKEHKALMIWRKELKSQSCTSKGFVEEKACHNGARTECIILNSHRILKIQFYRKVSDHSSGIIHS